MTLSAVKVGKMFGFWGKILQNMLSLKTKIIVECIQKITFDLDVKLNRKVRSTFKDEKQNLNVSLQFIRGKYTRQEAFIVLWCSGY